MGGLLSRKGANYRRQLAIVKHAYLHAGKKHSVASNNNTDDGRRSVLGRIRRLVDGVRERRRESKWCRTVRTFNGVSRLAAVESIYDGDTFTILTNLRDAERMELYKLRLADIDAPEMKLPKVAVGRELHMQAGKHVRDLLRTCLPQGTPLIVDFKREEKYGRLLGRVYTVKYEGFLLKRPVKHVDVCKKLVERGLCVSYAGATKEEFTPKKLKAILRVKTLSLDD
jgi:endonuclease YncB( thermonuclease family)